MPASRTHRYTVDPADLDEALGAFGAADDCDDPPQTHPRRPGVGGLSQLALLP